MPSSYGVFGDKNKLVICCPVCSRSPGMPQAVVSVAWSVADFSGIAQDVVSSGEQTS